MSRDVWVIGDYASVAGWIQAASLACLEGLEVGGRRVLDVACGMGTVALAAAKRGARVTGVDLTPEMLEVAGARAAEAGLEVVWVQGSFEDLSAHRGFDVVTSGFGVIFADDAVAVTRELLGALAPGGVVSLTAWSPAGAFGMPPGLATLIPQIQEAPDHGDFADARLEGVAREAGAKVLLRESRTLAIPFGSPEEALEALLRDSGPWIQAFAWFESLGVREQAAVAVRDHLAGFMGPEGLEVEYVLVRLAGG